MVNCGRDSRVQVKVQVQGGQAYLALPRSDQSRTWELNAQLPLAEASWWRAAMFQFVKRVQDKQSTSPDHQKTGIIHSLK